MLGDNLLVAPIFSHSGFVDYYVPAGRWTNMLDGRVVEGPRWLRETHDFMSLPLLVRPNSVIPIGNNSDRPDYDYADGVTLQVYQFEDGKQASVEIPSLTGKVQTTFTVSRAGNTLHMKRDGVSKSWQVLLAGIPAVASVEGGAAENSSRGVLVTLLPDANSLHIILY